MLIYVDETGDHSWSKIDVTYPIFGLGALIISEQEYQKMSEIVRDMKKEYFSDDGTFILHSSELKRPKSKNSDPRNVVMFDTATRARFFKEFDERVVSNLDYKIIACFIKKPSMIAQYFFPVDPYSFAFENLLNRIIRCGDSINSIYTEKRGSELDPELQAQYERHCMTGIHFYTSDEVKEKTTLQLIDKKENTIGLQVIDLILACLTRDYLGKTVKMIGNDLTPALLKEKYACPPTFFPYIRKKR